MSYLSIPLQVVKTGLARQANIKKSLDESINLLVSTPRFHNVADPNFGFIFNNMRFEIFDEHEGFRNFLTCAFGCRGKPKALLAGILY